MFLGWMTNMWKNRVRNCPEICQPCILTSSELIFTHSTIPGLRLNIFHFYTTNSRVTCRHCTGRSPSAKYPISLTCDLQTRTTISDIINQSSASCGLKDAEEESLIYLVCKYDSSIVPNLHNKRSTIKSFMRNFETVCTARWYLPGTLIDETPEEKSFQLQTSYEGAADNA